MPEMIRKSGPRLESFTLTELLIALVIVGILIYLALPDYSNVVSQAKAVEAKLQLEHVHALERSHFYERSKYSTDLEEIGFEQQKLTTEGGNANYQIEVTLVGTSGFRARATSVVDFDQDGVFNVWEMDEAKTLTEVTKD